MSVILPYTNLNHVLSFRLAASPFGLAASEARRPPQETVVKMREKALLYSFVVLLTGILGRL